MLLHTYKSSHCSVNIQCNANILLIHTCVLNSVSSKLWCIFLDLWLMGVFHDDVIKWKHFPRYWPFVRGINRPPVNSPHKGQWCGTLIFSLICTRISCWVNNREADDLRRHRADYDVIVMYELQKIKNTFHFHILQQPFSTDYNHDLTKYYTDWLRQGLQRAKCNQFT